MQQTCYFNTSDAYAYEKSSVIGGVSVYSKCAQYFMSKVQHLPRVVFGRKLQALSYEKQGKVSNFS